RPVDKEDGADQVPARYRAPLPRVARLGSVVAHEEVLAFRNTPAPCLCVPVTLSDVGLLQRPSVDVDEALLLRDRLARQSDQPLHERPALAALLLGFRRRLE